MLPLEKFTSAYPLINVQELPRLGVGNYPYEPYLWNLQCVSPYCLCVLIFPSPFLVLAFYAQVRHLRGCYDHIGENRRTQVF